MDSPSHKHVSGGNTGICVRRWGMRPRAKELGSLGFRGSERSAAGLRQRGSWGVLPSGASPRLPGSRPSAPAQRPAPESLGLQAADPPRVPPREGEAASLRPTDVAGRPPRPRGSGLRGAPVPAPLLPAVVAWPGSAPPSGAPRAARWLGAARVRGSGGLGAGARGAAPAGKGQAGGGFQPRGPHNLGARGADRCVRRGEGTGSGRGGDRSPYWQSPLYKGGRRGRSSEPGRRTSEPRGDGRVLGTVPGAARGGWGMRRTGLSSHRAGAAAGPRAPPLPPLLREPGRGPRAVSHSVFPRLWLEAGNGETGRASEHHVFSWSCWKSSGGEGATVVSLDLARSGFWHLEQTGPSRCLPGAVVDAGATHAGVLEEDISGRFPKST